MENEKPLATTLERETTLECPICYETLNDVKDCLTTSCGHRFHSSCILKHTIYNGYTCPCCRKDLVDMPKCTCGRMHGNFDSDEDSVSLNAGSSDGEDTMTINSREYNYGYLDVDTTEEVFTSFRWFHQRNEGEELEEDVFGFSTIDDSPYNDDAMKKMYEENKDQVHDLVTRIKEINKLPYERLLAAFLWKNCKDFRYNQYAEELSQGVTHMIDDIHARMLREENENHRIAQTARYRSIAQNMDELHTMYEELRNMWDQQPNFHASSQNTQQTQQDIVDPITA